MLTTTNSSKIGEIRLNFKVEFQLPETSRSNVNVMLIVIMLLFVQLESRCLGQVPWGGADRGLGGLCVLETSF